MVNVADHLIWTITGCRPGASIGNISFFHQIIVFQTTTICQYVPRRTTGYRGWSGTFGQDTGFREGTDDTGCELGPAQLLVGHVGK